MQRPCTHARRAAPTESDAVCLGDVRGACGVINLWDVCTDVACTVWYKRTQSPGTLPGATAAHRTPHADRRCTLGLAADRHCESSQCFVPPPRRATMRATPARHRASQRGASIAARASADGGAPSARSRSLPGVFHPSEFVSGGRDSSRSSLRARSGGCECLLHLSSRPLAAPPGAAGRCRSRHRRARGPSSAGYLRLCCCRLRSRRPHRRSLRRRLRLRRRRRRCRRRLRPRPRLRGFRRAAPARRGRAARAP